jgi:hypothetical protein
MVCSFEGCDHKRKARGLCMGHVRQFYRGQPLRPLGSPRGRNGRGTCGRRRTQPLTCSFDGCGREPNGKGLCAAHRAQKAQGRKLVPVGAAKRWWYPIEGRGA